MSEERKHPRKRTKTSTPDNSFVPDNSSNQVEDFNRDEARYNDEVPAQYESAESSQNSKRFNDLSARVRTAVIFFAATAALIIISRWTTLIYIVATAGLSASEFCRMLRSDAKLPNELLGIIGAMLFPVAVFFLGYMGSLYVTLALMLVLLIWYVFYLKARITDVAISFFGAVYTGLMLCGIIVIRDAIPDWWGGLFVFGIFFSVWANDAGGYLIGSRWGKHKLAPRISPNKSWEGFLAGLAVTMIVWAAMSFIPCVSITIIQALVFGLVVGLVGVLGDLAESRMKRNCGVKDSGNLLPGHGGMLDRSDSMFTVSIAAAVLLIAGGCI